MQIHVHILLCFPRCDFILEVLELKGIEHILLCFPRCDFILEVLELKGIEKEDFSLIFQTIFTNSTVLAITFS